MPSFFQDKYEVEIKYLNHRSTTTVPQVKTDTATTAPESKPTDDEKTKS
jgi:hypothetical protein